MLKISLAKAIRKATGMGLPNARRCTDDVLARREVVLTFSTPGEADEFQGEAEELGVISERQLRFR